MIFVTHFESYSGSLFLWKFFRVIVEYCHLDDEGEIESNKGRQRGSRIHKIFELYLTISCLSLFRYCRKDDEPNFFRFRVSIIVLHVLPNSSYSRSFTGCDITAVLSHPLNFQDWLKLKTLRFRQYSVIDSLIFESGPEGETESDRGTLDLNRKNGTSFMSWDSRQSFILICLFFLSFFIRR